MLEADHERGIAHLIEHLAFRGSKEQEGVFEMIRELESYGVQFGAHQNAVTGFESTMYELHVPTDDWELMTKAFFILRDLSLEVSSKWCGGGSERRLESHLHIFSPLLSCCRSRKSLSGSCPYVLHPP